MRVGMRRYVLAFAFVLVLPMLALAAVVFTAINRTGAADTLPSGINKGGKIVGTSETAAQELAGIEEGFIRSSGGTYSKVFFTGALDTDLGGINDDGDVVGTYGDSTVNNFDHCFIRDETGEYTSFDIGFPNDGFPDCAGINNDGDTVGSYFDTNTNTTRGWLREEDGTFSHVDVTFDGGVTLFETEAYGINSSNDVVGIYFNAGDHCFLRHLGIYHTIDVTITGASQTNCYGINNGGDIVGSYRSSLDNKDHGFAMSEGKFLTVDVTFTGAETNKVTGINDNDVMVGVYTSADGTEHGFKTSKLPI